MVAWSLLYYHIARYIYVCNVFVYVYIYLTMSVKKLSRVYMFIACTLSDYKYNFLCISYKPQCGEYGCNVISVKLGHQSSPSN